MSGLPSSSYLKSRYYYTHTNKHLYTTHSNTIDTNLPSFDQQVLIAWGQRNAKLRLSRLRHKGGARAFILPSNLEGRSECQTLWIEVGWNDHAHRLCSMP